MRTFLALGVAVLVGLTGNAVAQAPAPGIVAEASLQPQGGVLVVWTLLPGVDVLGYEISRSRDGAPFVVLGTADITSDAFLDQGGQLSDVYLVTAATTDASVTSNPAVVLPLTFLCPPINLVPYFPYVEINLNCIGGPHSLFKTSGPDLALLR